MIRPVLALLIAASSTAANAQTRSALQVIREDSSLVLVDGGSYYRFNRDSTFRSGPVGLSGRVITGRWRGGDDLFIVEGRWGWVNGQSLLDDYRRMTMRVARLDGPGTVKPLLGVGNAVRVHTGYYYVDEVMRIPPPTSGADATAGRPASSTGEIHVATNHIPGVTDVRWRFFNVDDPRWILEINFVSSLSASALPALQVWLLRGNGTVIAPDRAAVMIGEGFGGTGPPRATYHYDRNANLEAAAIVVKIGDEFLFKSVRR